MPPFYKQPWKGRKIIRKITYLPEKLAHLTHSYFGWHWKVGSWGVRTAWNHRTVLNNQIERTANVLGVMAEEGHSHYVKSRIISNLERVQLKDGLNNFKGPALQFLSAHAKNVKGNSAERVEAVKEKAKQAYEESKALLEDPEVKNNYLLSSEVEERSKVALTAFLLASSYEKSLQSAPTSHSQTQNNPTRGFFKRVWTFGRK
jgi:hypothetical protein